MKKVFRLEAHKVRKVKLQTERFVRSTRIQKEERGKAQNSKEDNPVSSRVCDK